MAILFTPIVINAQDNRHVKQPIELDLKPDFELELNRQSKIAENVDSHAIKNSAEQKRIYDIEHNTGRKKFSMSFGNSSNQVLNGMQPPSNLLRPE